MDDFRQLETELTEAQAKLANATRDRDLYYKHVQELTRLNREALAKLASVEKERDERIAVLVEEWNFEHELACAARKEARALRAQLAEVAKERDTLMDRLEDKAIKSAKTEMTVWEASEKELRDKLNEITKERDHYKSIYVTDMCEIEKALEDAGAPAFDIHDEALSEIDKVNYMIAERNLLNDKLTESARVSRVHQEQAEKQRVKDLETIGRLVEEYRILSEMVLEFDKEREQLSTKHEGGETVQPASASGNTESETPESDASFAGYWNHPTRASFSAVDISVARRLERGRDALKAECEAARQLIGGLEKMVSEHQESTESNVIGTPMQRQTATTAKPLSLNEAKAVLARLVAEGKVRPEGAALIDFREPTQREREIGEELARKRRKPEDSAANSEEILAARFAPATCESAKRR